MFFIKDQIRRNVLVSSDHGTMIVNRFDGNENRVGHGNFLLDHGHCTSLEAQITYDCLKHIAEPVIFDIGANIGTYVTWVSRSFPNGRVYCFEPQRLIFQILCGNLAINNIDNVYTYNMALGSTNEYLTFTEPDYSVSQDFGTFSLVNDNFSNKSKHVSTVPLHTVDNFCSVYDVGHIDFLKIDAEGMDIEIMKGALSMIERCSPYVFVEHFNNKTTCLNDIKEFFEKINYEIQVIENNVLARRIQC